MGWKLADSIYSPPAQRNVNFMPPDQVKLCSTCGGEGSVPMKDVFFMGLWPPSETCKTCDGKGRVPKEG